MMKGLLHPKPIQPLRVMWEAGLFLNCNVYWPCPTNCRYCFSMLSRRAHRVEGKSATDKALGMLIRMINKVGGPRYDETDFTQFLLHERYPVMVSNNSDPLSDLEVEFGYTKQYLDALADMGPPVNLLSKWQGWDRLDQDAYIETFKRNPRLWCSITITADNDDALQFWEPGAPPLGKRLDVIRQLTAAGIPVDVRVIPFIIGSSFPDGEWDDPETYRPFIQEVAEAGAFAISVSPLDFSIFDAYALDHEAKTWVADHRWSRSVLDQPWAYYRLDPSILLEVSEIWYREVKAAGMSCGIHQAVNSSIADEGDYACAVNAPEWFDWSLSWVRAAHRLHELQEQHEAPIVATPAMIAEYITRDHRHANHRFDWRSVRSLVPHPVTNTTYQGMVADEANLGAMIADIMFMQMDDIHFGWADTVWADLATAPVTPEQGSGIQLADDNEGLLISYDARRDELRPSWAACRTQHEWDGRTVEELKAAGAVLPSGEAIFVGIDQ